MTLDRTLAGLLALLHGANAVPMIAVPRYWYDSVPGVPATGPFNPHFVPDIGFIFALSAIGFAAWAWRPAYGAALLVAAASWPFVHGLFHLIHLGHVDPAVLPLEIGGVIVPGVLGAWIAWRAAMPKEA